MDLLLDTCTFLWWVAGGAEIPAATVARLRDPANRAFLSAASAWEIAIKFSLGRLPLSEPPGTMIPRARELHRIDALPIDEADALHLVKLPPLHRDPFDRMLVAQAICKNLTLVTPDPAVRAYPCRVEWWSDEPGT